MDPNQLLPEMQAKKEKEAKESSSDSSDSSSSGKLRCIHS